MELEIPTIGISFIIAIVLSIIIIPILKRLKVGQVVREDGPKTHLSKQGVPTMGGIIMLITIILLYIFNYNKYKEILPLVLYIISVGIVGFVDDFIKLILKNPKGLRPTYKMLGLLITAVGFIVYIVINENLDKQMYIPILKTTINVNNMIYIPFMIFIMLATTNSVNLTDGLDGLATGVVAIIMAFFTIVGIKNGMRRCNIYKQCINRNLFRFFDV